MQSLYPKAYYTEFSLLNFTTFRRNGLDREFKEGGLC